MKDFRRDSNKFITTTSGGDRRSVGASGTDKDNATLVLAMMLRYSLFMQWSGYKQRPDHLTTIDFQSALSEDHHRPALRLALRKYPTLNSSHQLALCLWAALYMAIDCGNEIY